MVSNCHVKAQDNILEDLIFQSSKNKHTDLFMTELNFLLRKKVREGRRECERNIPTGSVYSNSVASVNIRVLSYTQQ